MLFVAAMAASRSGEIATTLDRMAPSRDAACMAKLPPSDIPRRVIFSSSFRMKMPNHAAKILQKPAEDRLSLSAASRSTGPHPRWSQ